MPQQTSPLPVLLNKHPKQFSAGLSEHSHLDPTNPYSAAKAGAEMLCKVCTELASLSIVHFRISNDWACTVIRLLYLAFKALLPARSSDTCAHLLLIGAPPPHAGLHHQLQASHHHHPWQQCVWATPVP